GFAARYQEYAPYGQEMLGQLSAGAVTHGFTGHERDAATGLDYLHARYYDSGTGHFQRPDPAFDVNPLNPHSYNLYAYTHNNPVNYVDPDGEAVETAWDVASVTMGAVSFGLNIAQGNYLAATVDGVGLLIDIAATALPGVPGGAGA